MGYAYEIFGTKGAIRFDQEDQNALWLYKAEGREDMRGFRKILTGPAHPDYEPFCLGPGHGTGYQDQIIIEARDFLRAIETGQPVWPTFRDGLAVAEVVEAALTSARTGQWVPVANSKDRRHDHSYRQRALFLGRGICRRPAQPALAPDARRMCSGGLQRDRTGPGRLHARKSRQNWPRRWPSTT